MSRFTWRARITNEKRIHDLNKRGYLGRKNSRDTNRSLFRMYGTFQAGVYIFRANSGDKAIMGMTANGKIKNKIRFLTRTSQIAPVSWDTTRKQSETVNPCPRTYISRPQVIRVTAS